MEQWRLISLEIDDSAKEIGEYFEQKFPHEIARAEPLQKAKIEDAKKNINRFIDNALGNGLERKLVVYGSGFFHHYTYGLCRHADRLSDEYCYIHFDHHDDYESIFFLRQDEINCEGFVKKILEDTNAKKAFFVGSNVMSLGPGHSSRHCILEHQLRSGNMYEDFRDKLCDLPKDAYLSFDLDVMTPKAICTDFDQGTLKTKELLELIDLIKGNKNIIGADILGYSTVRNFEFPNEDIPNKGKELYAAIATSLLEA